MRYSFAIDGVDADLAVEVPPFFGPLRVLINGQPAPKGSKPREFLIVLQNGASFPVEIKFSTWGTRMSVMVGEVEVPLTQPLAWYEWAWMGLPLLLVIAGGMVGGFFGGLAAIVNLRLFRGQSNPVARYSLTGVVTFLAFSTYVMIAGGLHLLLEDKIRNPGKNITSSSTSSPVTAAPSRAEEKVREIVLPGDWQVLQEAFQAQILGNGHEKLTLRLGRVPEAVHITLPAGMVLRPVATESKVSPCMTRLPLVLQVPAMNASTDLDLWVVNMDAERWEMPRREDRYEIAGMETNPKLLQFMNSAREANLHYNLIQAGIWILMGDISREQFLKNRLVTNTYDVNLGTFLTTPLANYEGLRRLRLQIQGMGMDSMSFQLFKDCRAELEKELQRMDFDLPGANVHSSLVNGSLEAFGGEPETEALLLKYVTRHPDLSYREFAMKSLIKIGLSGDASTLFQQMVTTDHREHRLLTALALIRAGDMRGQPVLASFAEDPSLGKFIPGLKQEIQSKSRMAPLPDETALAYWERAVGWEALMKEGTDVAAVQALLQSQKTESDPWLDQFLGKLKGSTDQETQVALGTLTGRYKNHPKAFVAVREVLLTHPNWHVRQGAGRCLVDGWKGISDLRATVLEVLGKEQDQHVVSDLLRHALVFGKVSDPVPLIQLGLAHPLPEVRAATLAMISTDRNALSEEVVAAVLTPGLVSHLAETDPEPRVRMTALHQCLAPKSLLPPEQAEAILLRLAGKEVDKKVRAAALTRLCEAKSRSVIPLLKNMLSGSKEEKGEAIGCLDRWKTDPETLDLLESVRHDSDVGKYASNVLKRYGR